MAKIDELIRRIEDPALREELQRARAREKRRTEKNFGLVFEETFQEHTDVDGRTIDLGVDRTYPVLERGETVAGQKSAGAHHTVLQGENYLALRMLQFTHRRAIDVIYIDPPYNTGKKDFKYNDSFVDQDDAWRHSKWLSFMKPRLELARELLSDRGVIFISIDHNEHPTLRLLCDEIFGAQNRIADFAWVYEGGRDNQGDVKRAHEYVLAYSRRVPHPVPNVVIDPNSNLDAEIQASAVKNGPKNPPSSIRLPPGFPVDGIDDGVIRKEQVSVSGYEIDRDIEVANGRTSHEAVVTSGWMSKNQLEEYIAADFRPVKDTRGQDTVFYLSRTGNLMYRKDRKRGHIISVLRGLGTTTEASEHLVDDLRIDPDAITNLWPKPVGLVRYLVSMYVQPDSAVLDFFAGSGTTLEAILELNRDQEYNARCILVTNDEEGICSEVTVPRARALVLGTPAFEPFSSSFTHYTIKLCDRGALLYSRDLDPLVDTLHFLSGSAGPIDRQDSGMWFTDRLGILFSIERLAEFSAEAEGRGNVTVVACATNSRDDYRAFQEALADRYRKIQLPRQYLHSLG